MGDRTVYADLISVTKSQLLYGAGTSPSLKKHPELWRGEYALGRTPTVELITAVKDKLIKNGTKLTGKSKRKGWIW